MKIKQKYPQKIVCVTKGSVAVTRCVHRGPPLGRGLHQALSFRPLGHPREPALLSWPLYLVRGPLTGSVPWEGQQLEKKKLFIGEE